MRLVWLTGIRDPHHGALKNPYVKESNMIPKTTQTMRKHVQLLMRFFSDTSKLNSKALSPVGAEAN